MLMSVDAFARSRLVSTRLISASTAARADFDLGAPIGDSHRDDHGRVEGTRDLVRPLDRSSEIRLLLQQPNADSARLRMGCYAPAVVGIADDRIAGHLSTAALLTDLKLRTAADCHRFSRDALARGDAVASPWTRVAVARGRPQQHCQAHGNDRRNAIAEPDVEQQILAAKVAHRTQFALNRRIPHLRHPAAEPDFGFAGPASAARAAHPARRNTSRRPSRPLSACEMKRGAQGPPRDLGPAGLTRKRSSSWLATAKPSAHFCVASREWRAADGEVMGSACPSGTCEILRGAAPNPRADLLFEVRRAVPFIWPDLLSPASAPRPTPPLAAHGLRSEARNATRAQYALHAGVGLTAWRV